MLDIALLSMIGTMAYNQGQDLLGYNNSVILFAYAEPLLHPPISPQSCADVL
jgi:hypothetical protein